MMKKLFALIFYFFLSIGVLFAQHYKKDGTPDRRYKENKTYSAPTYKSEHSKKKTYNYSSTQRYSHGRIKRSSSARTAFMKQTGYSHGRKGYVIDHIVPLSKGGCDCPENMQWQTKEAAKAKDKWERK